MRCVRVFGGFDLFLTAPLATGARMNDEHKSLPADRLLQPTTMRWFLGVFGASLVYAIVRYHFAGDVAWRHFPLFILNKAASLAAVVFVASSYLVGKIIHWYDGDKALRLVVIKFCGLMGFFLAGIHAFFSFALLQPAKIPICRTLPGRS